MIRLTKIIKKENKISCIAYVEDCEVGINLKYDINKGVFENYILPKKYEYCNYHIAFAKRYFDKTIIGEEELLNERLIMWY